MRTVTRSLLIIMAVVLVVALVMYWRQDPTSIHQVYTSPDKRFKLVLYSYYRFFAMPGSGSADHAEGLLCLYDTSTGKELARCKVGLVMDVQQVEWSATNVYIKLIADWNLPQK